MTDLNQTPVAATIVEQYTLSDEVRAQVGDTARDLSEADKSFESAISRVAETVARIMGAEPSYNHWTAVAGAFQIDYLTDKGCKPETAQKRWFAVAGSMAETFALEKPAKPTKAAEVKSAQRKGAAAEADAVIAKMEAATPADVLAIATNPNAGPLAKPVIAALAKIAGEMAGKAAEAANKAAKDETKTLRDSLRKSIGTLNLVQLREVAALVESFAPVVETEDAPM